MERARVADERLGALVQRGQRTGDVRIDFPAEWVATVVTWLVVGAADGSGWGVWHPTASSASVSETVLGALTASPNSPAAD